MHSITQCQPGEPKEYFNNVGIGTTSVKLIICIFRKILHQSLLFVIFHIFHNFVLPLCIVDYPHRVHNEIISLFQCMKISFGRIRILDKSTTKLSSFSDNLLGKNVLPDIMSSTDYEDHYKLKSTHPSSWNNCLPFSRNI